MSTHAFLQSLHLLAMPHHLITWLGRACRRRAVLAYFYGTPKGSNCTPFAHACACPCVSLPPFFCQNSPLQPHIHCPLTTYLDVTQLRKLRSLHKTENEQSSRLLCVSVAMSAAAMPHAAGAGACAHHCRRSGCDHQGCGRSAHLHRSAWHGGAAVCMGGWFVQYPLASQSLCQLFLLPR